MHRLLRLAVRPHEGHRLPGGDLGLPGVPERRLHTRHLPSLLGFTEFLRAEREKLSEAEWRARYGLAFERVTTGITPKFSAEQITTARLIAEANRDHLPLPARILAQIT